MNNYDLNDFNNNEMMPFNNITLPNMDGNVGNQPQNNMQMLNNLATPYEGFIRGNLFNNLYEPYKNYKPARLVPRSEQEEMYLNLSQMSFAAHELNLYLDIYPNDQNMLREFNRYREMTNRLMRDYENKYGPLTVSSDSLNQAPWMWVKGNFPWDEGGM